MSDENSNDADVEALRALLRFPEENPNPVMRATKRRHRHH